MVDATLAVPLARERALAILRRLLHRVCYFCFCTGERHIKEQLPARTWERERLFVAVAGRKRRPNHSYLHLEFASED